MELPIKKIKIVSTGKNKFSGLTSYPRTTKVITTELANNGLYSTGLTLEEETFFEDKLQLKKGTLAKRPLEENGENFWSKLEIKLDTKRNNELDLQDPIQYIKYKVLLASSKVCNSPLEKSKFPSADWMIIDDEQISEVESLSIDKQLEAMEIFHSMSEEEKKGILKLYGKRNLENSKPQLIKSTLYKEVEKDPERFTKLATDKSLKTRILLEDLLSTRLVTKNGNYYKNGDDPIGNSTEEVLSYLEDPKNQSVVIALKGKLKTSK